MARMLVNGVRLNVEVTGKGPPVFALHGFAGSIATWEAFVAAAKDYTVVRVDLLGHGGSDAPADPRRYTMERCVDDLGRLVELLGFTRVHWLGYSMGGRIALGAVIAMPQRTASVILESASPGLATSAERADRVRADEALAERIEREGIQRFVDYWEALPLFAGQACLPTPIREKLRRNRLGNSPVGLANSLRGIGTGAQPPLHGKLSSLSAPCLFIAGEQDAKFVAIAKEMHTTVAHSQLRIIRGASHSPHLEQPAEFTQVVLGFLASESATNGATKPQARRPSDR